LKNSKLLILTVCAAVIVPAISAQVTWTGTTRATPVTIAGGPWTLAQGGPYTPSNSTGPTTAGGPFDGTIPYCSGGVPIVNSAGTVNPASPYYFPFVAGRGNNLQGYFDYRPRNVNEAIVAASSTDGGQTWEFQNQIENLNQVCPATDKNGSGNDDGVGHPYVINFAGAGFLYALDRRNGHVDNDGLLVHTLKPIAGSPLNGLPVNTEFGPPGTSAIPTSAIIAQWDFAQVTGGSSSSPAPNIGTGTATALGMTNSYKGPSPTCSGAACTYTGSTNKDDITGTTGGTDPSLAAAAWRVRGTTKLTGGNSGPGWNTQAPEHTQGAQFAVSTLGRSDIVVQFDWYTTAEAIRDLQVQYTTDGSTWQNVGPVYIAPVGGGFYPGITVNFAGIAAVNNNPNFAVRMVTVYDRSANAPTPRTYTAATLSATGAPVQYNDASGNWRFDEVNVLGSSSGGALPQPTKTTGLINPDGILAYVPNSYPFKILYVDKTLSADYSFPTSQQCGLTPSGAAANHDVEIIHMAQSTDSVHWTDLGAVNGLNDPTTTSYSRIRYMAPNGTLLKLSTGKWGLFFGGGNCLDGDSDGFHAIMYAESTDLLNWTVINGINNPIASVSQVTATDPVSNQVVTIPANTPVIGGTQPWFSGRVYNPNAMVAAPNAINLIFDGYDAAYSGDISDYRTIGHVTLSATGATLP